MFGRVFLKEPLDLPKGFLNLKLEGKMSGLLKKTRSFILLFRAGLSPYIPSIVKQISSKEEFVTTYTPIRLK